MKHYLLIIFLLLSATTFAQMETTKTPITGLGEFALGMSPEEMEDILKICKTSNTKIAGIFDGESSLMITNLKILGYTFNSCSFTFIDNALTRISVGMDFDKKNKDPKEFEDLLSALESDYGIQKRKGGDKTFAYIWQNKDKKMVMLSKNQEKKKTTVSILVTVDILDSRNMEVYKLVD